MAYIEFDSDLALERRKIDTEISGIDYRREYSAGGIWERITVRTEEGAESIGRPKGIYDTLTTDRMDLVTDSAPNSPIPPAQTHASIS